MTKKLEEEFNLPPMQDTYEAIPETAPQKELNDQQVTEFETRCRRYSNSFNHSRKN